MEIASLEIIDVRNLLFSAQLQLKRDHDELRGAIGQIADTISQEEVQKGADFRHLAEKFAHMRHPCSSSKK